MVLFGLVGSAPTGEGGATKRRINRSATKSAMVENPIMMKMYFLPMDDLKECGYLIEEYVSDPAPRYM